MGTLMPLVPPSLGYRLFTRIGDLSYDKGTTARQNVDDNLRHVLGEQADPARTASVAREIFRNQARNYYDLFRVASLSEEKIRQLVTVHGLEHIEQALSQGKGLIAVTAHFGNLDVVAQAFALHKYPITVVAEHLKPEKLFQYVTSLRASKGIQIIPADSFLRPIFRTLRQNGIVGIAADRNLTGTGSVVNLFGAPALLPDGHVQLALRTGAPLGFFFSLRRPDNTFEAHIEPPLDLERTGDQERDVRSGMAQIAAVLEKHIGQHPEQWVMFQPIWSVQPRGAAERGQLSPGTEQTSQ
ncbi:MAG TPA: lysophospholipid acyltransferase family protein [Anaerolineae bacterium]|nr:lysophospholipid acyltransferase family protein [Anaerolineae bacterium]HQJ52072.1 lysophospholipid acyltransferase family protein [Anaerolineae bacterium]